MILTSQPAAGMLILHLTGRLDAVTAPRFGEQCRAMLPANPAKVVLNCEQLEYLSSAGLRTVLELRRTLQENGSTLALCALSGDVPDLFLDGGCS